MALAKNALGLISPGGVKIFTFYDICTERSISRAILGYRPTLHVAILKRCVIFFFFRCHKISKSLA